MKHTKFLSFTLSGLLAIGLITPQLFAQKVVNDVSIPASTVTTVSSPSVVTSPSFTTTASTPTSSSSPMALALSKLQEGNGRYFNNKSQPVDTSTLRRTELSAGQNPFALVVSCSDSRVVAPLVFNQGLGDLFEVKLAGNILNKEALGTIEYGVEHLNIPVIVIMGHEKCGAVHATVDACKSGSYPKTEVLSLISSIKPAYYQASKALVPTNNIYELTCDKNIEKVKAEVLSNEVVKELVKEGKLQVVTAKYFLDGHVEWR